MQPSTTQPILDLLPAPRRAIVEYLKERGPSRAEDIARDLAVTISGIRQHLASLGAQGFVTFDVRRGSPGRPKHYFHLTGEGDNLFRKDYAAFAVESVAFLRKRAPELLRELFQSHLDARFRGIRARAARLTFPEQVQVLADDMKEAGYMPAVTADGDGSYHLSMRNCPLLEIARCAPEYCEMEAAEVSRVTGGSAQVAETQIAGSLHCVYRLQPPATDQ